MEKAKAIKVVLADSNRLIQLALGVLFSEQKDIQIVGEANNSGELKDILNAFETDVVLIDYTAPGFSIDIIPVCVQKFPEIKFVAITPDQMGSTIVHALRAGVVSYIKKDCDFNEITNAVRETAIGGKFFCGQVLDTIRKESIDVNDLDLSHLSCEPVTLSERELEIITLIAEGLTNGQIAEKLFLSPHTVNTHRKNIMQKLGVNNTASIVMYAVKTNLVNANKFLFSGG